MAMLGKLIAGVIIALTALVFALMPVNKVLEATPPAGADAATRRLIERWGSLHAVRSALGVGATLVYLWAIL